VFKSNEWFFWYGSEEMFFAAAVEKGREAVGKMAEKANQDVLQRIHCANLGEKRVTGRRSGPSG
jgi:hypothetical protein